MGRRFEPDGAHAQFFLFEGLKMKPPGEAGTIFFIHRGPVESYLTASILQAHHASPQSDIVFLTDQPETLVPRAIRHVAAVAAMSEYSSSAETFADAYRFDGINSYDYELMNFQRWFFVAEYCQKQQIDGPALVLDSDAFLFLPVELVMSELGTDQSVVDEVGPQFSFFSSPAALNAFTNYLLTIFLDPKELIEVENFVENYGHPGLPHVSDMAALGRYARLHILEDLGKPERTTFVFCENIGSPQGLQLGHVGKKIRRRAGQRFFITAAGRRVLAGGVHLQGGNKVLWPFFVDGKVRRKMLRCSPVLYISSLCSALSKVAKTRAIRLMSRLRNSADSVKAKKLLRK